MSEATERAAHRRLSTAKLVGGILSAIIVAIGTGAIWGESRASVSYVDAGDKATMGALAAAQKDQVSKNEAILEALTAIRKDVAELKTEQAADATTNKEAHKQIANDFAEVRGYIVRGHR